MLITLVTTSYYIMTRERGSQYAVIQRVKDRAGKRSPPISLQEIDSLGLLRCSKTEFDRIARTLCTISKRDKDQQEDDVVPAPVTLPNKLTRAEKQKLKKQKTSTPPSLDQIWGDDEDGEYKKLYDNHNPSKPPEP